MVDAKDVAELAKVLDKYPWAGLFSKHVIEEDDLPDDLEYVQPYYEALKHACASEGVVWSSELL